MYDALVVVILLGVGLGVMIVVAHTLDKRRKKVGPIGPEPPKLGPAGRWVSRAISVLLMLSAISAVSGTVLHATALTWLAIACFVLFIPLRFVLHVVRLSGI